MAADENKGKEFRLVFGLFAGYGFYSLLRKSFSVSVPFMRTSLGLSKADVGNIATSFSVAYGISKFVGGVVSDFLPPDVLFATGLFLAALSNLLFSFSTSTSVLCVLWFLNGTVQGFGWPALTHIVTNNVSPSRAGTTWSVLICGGNLGYLLGPFFLLPLTNIGWQLPFRVCGLVGMGFACAVYIMLSSCKKSSVTGKFEINNDKGINKQEIRTATDTNGNDDGKDSNNHKTVIKSEPELDSEETKSKILLDCAFSLNLWLLMLVGGLTTFVLKSMSDWTGLLLVEYCGLSISTSTELMLWNEIGGMTGTLACGILSDYLGGRKYLTVLIFVIICVISIAYFPDNIKGTISDTYEGSLEEYFSNCIWVLSLDSLYSNSTFLASLIVSRFSGKLGLARLSLFCMGFGINGPKTLLGVMIRDLVPRGVSGTIGGIFGLVAQIGASASGAGLGYILEVYGWEPFMTFLLYGVIAIAVALFLPVATINSTTAKAAKQKEL